MIFDLLVIRTTHTFTMSYAQRFMQKKDTAPDAEGWQQVGGGGGGGMGSGFPSAFSKPKREERTTYQKQWSAPKPKEINLNSAEQFPSLGRDRMPVSAVQTTNWALKAASWAAADETDAIAERRRQAEQEEADKERRRLTSGVTDLLGSIMRRRNEGNYRTTFQEPLDDHEVHPRSPPYDPDYELAEYAAAAASAPNPHLHDEDADNDGWN